MVRGHPGNRMAFFVSIGREFALDGTKRESAMLILSICILILIFVASERYAAGA